MKNRTKNGKYNFNSEMDYIQIALGKADTTNGVALSSLTLDDENYALTYNKNRTEYTVYLPEGHPAVPRIEATAANGLTVEVQQAYIPDGKSEGTAYAVVSNGQGKSTTYTVKFVKNEKVDALFIAASILSFGIFSDFANITAFLNLGLKSGFGSPIFTATVISF
mgnify:CR=1 FL=1